MNEAIRSKNLRQAKFEKIKAELGEGQYMNVVNLNEYEAATCIELALLLHTSKFKKWVLLPILSIVTLFYFPVRLYWSRRMQQKWLYDRANSLEEATDIFIIGRGKIYTN